MLSFALKRIYRTTNRSRQLNVFETKIKLSIRTLDTIEFIEFNSLDIAWRNEEDDD